jgi:hypothetical protein
MYEYNAASGFGIQYFHIYISNVSRINKNLELKMKRLSSFHLALETPSAARSAQNAPAASSP